MSIEAHQPPTNVREKLGVACEWIGAVFSAFFVIGLLMLLVGFGDLREGGEAGFGLALTLPPVLLLCPLAIILRGPRRAVVAWISLCPPVLCFFIGTVAGLPGAFGK